MVVPVLCACRARDLPRAVALAHVLPCCGRDWWRRPGPDGGGDDPDGGDDDPDGGDDDPRAERRDAGQQPAVLKRRGTAVITAVDVAAAVVAVAFAAVVVVVDIVDMADMAVAVVAVAVVFAAVFVVVAPPPGPR